MRASPLLLSSALLASAAFTALLLLAWSAEASPGPASAPIRVDARGAAQDCFTAAKSGRTPSQSVARCDVALENVGLSPQDRAALLINRAAIEMDLDQLDLALADYDRGIALNPAMADAYVDRGGAYIAKGSYDRAIADINHGLKLGPDYAFVAYYNRAVAEEFKGDYKTAKADFRKTLKLNRGFKPAGVHLTGDVMLEGFDRFPFTSTPSRKTG